MQTVDTLRLSVKDCERLVDAVNHRASGVKPHEERRGLRVPYCRRRVTMDVKFATGHTVRHRVLARNLSRRGMSVLMGQYVNDAAACEVTLPLRLQETATLSGRVRACRHLGGKYHEVGVVFDQPIDIRDFTDLSPQQNDRFRGELVSELSVGGRPREMAVVRVLVVESNLQDRKVLTHFLKAMEFQPVEATSVTDIVSALTSYIDLVICGLSCHEEDREAIALMRDCQFAGPLIGLLGDDSAQVRAAAKQAGADTTLTKPYTRQQLEAVMHQQLQGHGLIHDGESAIVSDYADDAAMRPLLKEFLLLMPQYVDQLRRSLGQHDLPSLREACSQLRGSGGTYGYGAISEAATDVLTQLSDLSAEVEQDLRRRSDALHDSVQQLVQTLHRLRLER